jgi:poly-gamma-glutamate capsule biosynthesis protein CapA/YwtB (metallophosphatase superfamily)
MKKVNHSIVKTAGMIALVVGLFFGAYTMRFIALPYFYFLEATVSDGINDTISKVQETITPEKKPAQTTLTFVGDIMLDRGVRRSVEKNFSNNYSLLFQTIPELKSADITFGNLEGPISKKGKNVGSKYSFRMDPDVIPALRDAGFDIVSFANNHVGDWGLTAFNDTRNLLHQGGILYTGAGDTLSEAEKPTIIEKNGITFGYLGFSDVGPEWITATDNTAGILSTKNPRYKEIISKAKESVDILIISVHWGEEYKPHTKRQEQLAKEAIDAGATIVVGHHPHIAQDIELYNNGVIIYSLGNFIFDQYFSDETMRGLVVTATFENTKLTSIFESEIQLDSRYQPKGITPKKEHLNTDPDETESSSSESLTFGFVGDIVPGETYDPSMLVGIQEITKSPDIMVGNLEGVLTNTEGQQSSKCSIATKRCYAFSGKESFAAILKEAGFDILSIANNHSNDFGPAGLTSTVKLLDDAGLASVGQKDTISYIEKNGITVGFIGFSTYAWTNHMDAKEVLVSLIKEARTKASIVVILFHAGAEGVAFMHTPSTREYYLGENRGEVVAFSHAAIDAGADIVIGSGPHVMRGVESYKGKLIAYSLGNFASAGNLSTKDFLKNAGILLVTITKNGAAIDGSFISTKIINGRITIFDTENTGLALLQLLSKQDFPQNTLQFQDNGKIHFIKN